MFDFDKILNDIIFKNPNVFLKKLKQTQFFKFEEYKHWKNVYDNFNSYFIKEDIKNPPKGYFRVFLYHNDPESTRKFLINNFEAIPSRYSNLDMFVPVSYFEIILDECFKFSEFEFIHVSELCYEKNLIWDLRLLRKYKKLITEFREHEYLQINKNMNIKLNFDIVDEFKDYIEWGSILHFNDLKWDFDKLVKYKEYIKFKNKEEFSSSGTYREFGFSMNLEIDWTLNAIKTFSDKWSWPELCLNKFINWNISFIQNLADRVDFDSLSSNHHIDWSLELIEKFKNRWNWQNLSGNPSLPWSLDLLKKYENMWKWNVQYNDYIRDYRSEGFEVESNFEPSISTNPGIVWDLNMISLYKDKLDIWRLARRGNLNLEVIKNLENELFKNQHIGWKFHDKSDFMTITEKIYLTGWENLARNTLFKLSPDTFDYLKNNNITLTYADGNLQDDGKYVTTNYKLIDIFRNSTFISNDYMISAISDEHLSRYFITDTFINDQIFNHLLVPYFIKNEIKIFNEFMNIKVSN